MRKDALNLIDATNSPHTVNTYLNDTETQFSYSKLHTHAHSHKQTNTHTHTHTSLKRKYTNLIKVLSYN